MTVTFDKHYALKKRAKDIYATWQMALQNREAQRAELHTANGKPKYLQAAMDEEQATIDDVVNRAAANALEQLTALLNEIDNELMKGDLDPLTQLTPSELARAEFIREDAERLPLPDAAKRLDAVRVHRPLYEKILSLRYYGYRLQRERDLLAAGSNAVPPDGMEALIGSLARLAATIPQEDTAGLRDAKIAISRQIATVNGERYVTVEKEAQTMKVPF